MTNPWLELTEDAPYILESDKIQVKNFTTKQKKNARLQLESIPEPFIGNPKTARVVFLLLNPGHKEKEDTKAHRKPEFQDALFKNLSGQPQRYPFYPLNPAFVGTPTAKWWIPRTRELLTKSDLSLQTFSERLLALEWFPYHSVSSGLPTSQVCASQAYTFEIARRMVEKKVLIVRMRSEKHWSNSGVQGLENVPALRNPRCGYISRNNAGQELFDKIVEALK